MFSKSGLDVARFIGLPAFGLSWFLKMSQVKLDLITDREMMAMLERGLRYERKKGHLRFHSIRRCYFRGGLSWVNTRHFEVRDEKKDAILLLDVNNQYGGAMREKLLESTSACRPKKVGAREGLEVGLPSRGPVWEPTGVLQRRGDRILFTRFGNMSGAS